MSSYNLSHDDKLQIIQYINNYRKKHNSGDLTYDEVLTNKAQQNAIIMLKEKKLKYNNEDYSQVLYCLWTCRNQKMENIFNGINKCYNESKIYNFSEYSISNAKKCKNFTALIWKESTKIGIGYAYVNGKCVLCLYLTNKGNIPALYNTNVLPIQTTN